MSRLLAVLVLALPASAQVPDSLQHSIFPPPGAQTGAALGSSVAVDGNYIVVGAPLDDIGAPDAGVVKVFHSTTGALLFVLTNPNPEANDRFGTSVGVSGTRVVVGAPHYNGDESRPGNAYVYDLSGATPASPIATLNNPNPSAPDYDSFGQSVAISGTRVVVGSPDDVTGAYEAGTAYVYDLSAASPTSPMATLNKPSPADYDSFGYSVSISGTRVIVGAYGDDSEGTNAGRVYVYSIGSETVDLVAELEKPGAAEGDFFGYSVSISGTRAIVGAYGDHTGGNRAGRAFVYDLNSASPSLVATLNNPSPAADDLFGWSVAISGDRAVVGAYGDIQGGNYNAGSAYVYDLGSGTPTVPIATLNNPAPAADDQFGFSVAISGTRVVAGASRDDTGAEDAGSAYVYDMNSGTPAVPTLSLNNPGPVPGDSFGSSVAIDGTFMVAGAPLEDTGNTDAGSVFVYNLASETPTVAVATLRDPSPAMEDHFGNSVAISGNRVVVGAAGDDTDGQNAGIVYVYDLNSATPTAPAFTLRNPGPATNDGFGGSVAISGSRVVVGASGDDTGAADSGSVYVFNLNIASTSHLEFTLNNPTPAAGDNFGDAVAISGTRVAVGARLDDTGAIDAGSVYVFNLSSGTPLVPVATLNKPGPAAGDQFGFSVAISGTRVVVGAPHDDTGASDAGSAYVFDVSSGTPSIPVATLNNPTPAANDSFGASVSISGTRVVVGAEHDQTGAADAGTAYVYDLSSGTPTAPVAALNNPSPATGDLFAHAVAISGTTVVIGAPSDDTIVFNKGAAYIFGPDNTPPAGGTMTLTPASPVDASAALTVDFADWSDANLPLGYTVLIDDVIVSPAGPAASRNIPGPAAAGAHTLKGRVADAKGNVTEVMQAFTVLTPMESWRRLYFGTTENAGVAADTADPDGDGCTNLFEYVAGLIPTSAPSRFHVRIEPVAGEPTQKAIIFGPLVAGRTYVVKSSSNLTGPTWTALGTFNTADNGNERTVTDLQAQAAPKFYMVEITTP